MIQYWIDEIKIGSIYIYDIMKVNGEMLSGVLGV